MVSFLGFDFYFQLNLIISVSIDVVENRYLFIQISPFTNHWPSAGELSRTVLFYSCIHLFIV